MEGETSKKITNAHGAELNSTDGPPHDVSLPLLAKFSPIHLTMYFPFL